MSPRPYQVGRRRAITEQTRARILGAARELLEAPKGLATFSMDAIARQADVARMTVYYQFGSKAGLIEALFDDLADRGGMDRLPDAFRRPEPLSALDTLIGIFGHFSATYRLINRRLRALSALDPDLERALYARNERRRAALRVIVRRVAQRHGDHASGEDAQPERGPEALPSRDARCAGVPRDAVSGSARGASYAPKHRTDADASADPEDAHDRELGDGLEEIVAVLHMLTSFESFDILAAGSRRIEEVIPLVQRVAHAILQQERIT